MMRCNHSAVALLLLLAVFAVGCRGGPAEATLPGADWVLSEGRWESYPVEGLAGEGIRGMAADAQGRLWVGTLASGGWFDGTDWHPVVAVPTLDVAVDQEGRAWLVGGSGLQVYDGETLVDSDPDVGLYGMCVLIDSQRRIWIGNFQSGSRSAHAGAAQVLQDGEWISHGADGGAADGLTYSTIYNLAEDRSGAIWAAASVGIAWYDGSSWELMTLPDQPAVAEVISVAVDASNRVWFGTRRYGLWIRDGESWTQYTSADGLASDTVWAIAMDGAGRAWLGTPEGLSVFDGETWITYTTEDGLPSNNIHALNVSADGVWVGTTHGLCRLTFD
jgi:ligand-binding sensor domain-containing protein